MQRYHYRLTLVIAVDHSTLDPTWHNCWLLVSGKVRHAQGQRLNRFEVRRKRESERTKGEGKMSTLFPLFLTPHFKLNLKVLVGHRLVAGYQRIRFKMYRFDKFQNLFFLRYKRLKFVWQLFCIQ